jgi:alpha-tubulin suppressor-like RCC1 family protein/tRNA A-37 threonylcarbamoyl transferase component Bud32
LKPPDPPADLPRFAELESEYEILRELGRGGTAVVYLARERELGRTVALKVIRSTYIEDTEAAARLMREARTVGSLQHPNIVMLYGTRRLRDDSLALIMQYVPGETLKTEIRKRGALPFERVTRILNDVGRALAHAHRNRIVHRDIKPENVYLDDESDIARLSDFGIARSWDSDSSLTLPGSAIGTPAYMSPEQIDGDVLDGRSDIYSLGLVGYEMLTGETPWAGESLFRIIYKQKHEDLPSLAERRPGIPDALRRAVEGALRKDPADRWASAHEFLAALNGEELEPGVTTAPAAGAATGEESSDAAPSAATDSAAAAASPATDDEANVTIQYRRADLLPEPEPEAVLPSLVTASAVQQPEDVGDTAEQPRRRRALAVAALLTLVLAGTAAALMISHWAGDRREEIAAAGPVSAPVSAAAGAADALADGAPGAPARSFALQGAMQNGVTGDTLPEPLVVRVEDEAGRPVMNAVVRFALASGDGAVRADSTLSDEFGAAQTFFLPLAPGLHTIQATVDGVPDAGVTFSARVARRTAAQLAATSPRSIRGESGTRAPLVVRVEDDRGQPLQGVQVRFAVQAGDGRLVLPELGVTDADGTARAEWVLGTGTQQVVATVPELPGSVVEFEATSGAPARPVRRSLATGGTHTCTLESDGTAACWGGNDSGQLGDGSGSRRAAPVPVAAPEPLTTLVAGVAHTCGIGASGAAFCWGANTAGQIGDGSRSSRTRPTRVAVNQRLVSLAAGNAHSCGLDSTGVLYCWGQNSSGQIGDGTRADRLVPVIGGGNRAFRLITLGWAHSCGVTVDGEALCWGANGTGELGDGSATDRLQPVRVSGGHRFTMLVAGSAHSCGLRNDGRILCWGRNSNGQLGNGGTGTSLVPVPIDSPLTFSAVTVGGVHSCGLARDGTAHCWGRNTYGQLGDGTTDDRSTPVAVEGGHRFASLSASGAHTCGTTVAGQRYCWGFNQEGQLGDGTRQNRTRPVAAGR